MDSKERHNLRLAVLAGFLALVVLIYVGVLYDTQVVNYDKYIAQSIRSIAREEKVAASRGVITDRTGRALSLIHILVEKIHGDFFNVMGLPVLRLSRMLLPLGVHCLD